MKRTVLSLSIAVLTGFSGAGGLGATDTGPQPAPAEFTIAGMTCPTCVEPLEQVLKKIPGVRAARVDFETKTARLTSARPVSRDQVRQALATLGFEPRFPGDSAPPALSEEEKAGLDILLVSRGESIRLEDFLAPGKITLFDFYADWCGPCRLLTPKLERLLTVYPDLALRTIDLVDWESDMAVQATREFKLPGLPYVRIYGKDGRFLEAVRGNDIDQIEEAIRRGR